MASNRLRSAHGTAGTELSARSESLKEELPTAGSTAEKGIQAISLLRRAWWAAGSLVHPALWLHRPQPHGRDRAAAQSSGAAQPRLSAHSQEAQHSLPSPGLCPRPVPQSLDTFATPCPAAPPAPSRCNGAPAGSRLRGAGGAPRPVPQEPLPGHTAPSLLPEIKNNVLIMLAWHHGASRLFLLTAPSSAN